MKGLLISVCVATTWVWLCSIDPHIHTRGNGILQHGLETFQIRHRWISQKKQPTSAGNNSSAACLDLPSQRAIRDRWLARATCPNQRLQTLLLIVCQPRSLLSLHRIPFPCHDKPCLGSTRRYNIRIKVFAIYT